MAGPALRLQPTAVAAVSAGSAFACAAFGGATDAVLQAFKRRTAANPSNVYPRQLMRSGPGSRRGRVFPHEPMYRGTILETMNASVLARLKQGPQIRVLMTRPPARLPGLSALAVGFAAYGLDRFVGRNVHATSARRLGFRSTVATVQSCTTAAQLADLIMHSSCMPPLTPAYQREGTPVIDGALFDSAPAELVDEHERTLVLLSRPYKQLPTHPSRLYVQPSREPAVSMWDYTSPERIQQTFDLGRTDGEAFANARHG